MPKPIADGSHYIQKSNQDYWLRLNGVWVRMGNIRDEGTGGLVDVPPIWGHGLVMEVTHLDRIRYIPDEAGHVENFGFDTTITALDRIRYMGQIPNSMGFAVAPISLLRVKQLTASFNMGFITQAQLHREIAIQAAFNMGFTMAVATDAQVVHQLNVPMAFGLSTAATVSGSVALSAAFAMGFSQGVALEKNLGPITESLGFSMGVTALQRIRNITASMAMGFSTSVAVSGFFGTHYIPTNTTFTGSAAPSSVNTSFTFSASGNALESHLYDGDPTTPAADPRGVRSDTHAAYDLGTATFITGVTITTAPANGFADAITFKVQWSDTGLTGPWTDAGTVVVPAGLGQTVAAGVTASSHRYWQIVYTSGTQLGNAWLGELTFGTAYTPWDIGFRMAAPVQRIKTLPGPIANGVGYSMVVVLAKIKALPAVANAVGFSMSAPALTITHMLTVPMALGFNEAVTVQHFATSQPQIPTAVQSTFTYTGQTPAAAESHLYDSNDTTDAADPAGLSSSTFAAYDLGSAKPINSIRLVNSNRFTSSTPITYKIQYSDTSISGAWTDTGVTITMPATLGAVQTATLSGTHRYWRIIYSSGTVSQNAWLGELQFRN